MQQTDAHQINAPGILTGAGVDSWATTVFGYNMKTINKYKQNSHWQRQGSRFIRRRGRITEKCAFHNDWIVLRFVRFSLYVLFLNTSHCIIDPRAVDLTTRKDVNRGIIVDNMQVMLRALRHCKNVLLNATNDSFRVTESTHSTG